MDTDKPWIKNITVDSLPNDDLKIVATLISLDVAIKMMSELPGIHISVPKNGMLKAKIDYVMRYYDGSKFSRCKLAKECDLTESYIYRIARNKRFYKQ